MEETSAGLPYGCVVVTRPDGVEWLGYYDDDEGEDGYIIYPMEAEPAPGAEGYHVINPRRSGWSVRPASKEQEATLSLKCRAIENTRRPRGEGCPSWIPALCARLAQCFETMFPVQWRTYQEEHEDFRWIEMAPALGLSGKDTIFDNSVDLDVTRFGEILDCDDMTITATATGITFDVAHHGVELVIIVGLEPDEKARPSFRVTDAGYSLLD